MSRLREFIPKRRPVVRMGQEVIIDVGAGIRGVVVVESITRDMVSGRWTATLTSPDDWHRS